LGRYRYAAGLGLGLVLGLLVPAVSAQTGASLPLSPALSDPIPTQLSPDLVAPAASDTYQVGIEDLLDIFVYEMPEMTRQVRVDNRGLITLPFLPRPIQALGSTGPQIAAAVAEQLQRAGLARAPLVQVIVRQVSSHLIFLTGAFKTPGVIDAVRPLSLAEIIARGGGLAPDAGDRVRVTKPGGAGAAPVSQEYDLEPILGGVRAGPVVLGGDAVEVEPARMVYVVGAVEKPGAFPLHAGQPITIMRALALSGGIKDPADQKHSHLIQPSPVGGSPNDSVVNIAAVMARRAPDPPLEADDILYIPESGKQKAAGIALTSALQAAVLMIGYNAKLF